MAKLIKVKNQVGVYTYPGVNGKCYYINYRENGRLKVEKVGWDHEGYNAKLASAVRGERVRDIRHGKELGITRDITMDEAFKKYVQWAMNNRKKDVAGDLSRYNNHVKPYLGHFYLSNITVRDIEGLKGKWSNLALGSHNNMLILIRKIFNRMITLDYYSGTNPVTKVEKVKPNNQRLRFLNYDEANALLEVLEKIHPETHLMATIGIFTGLRLGEILELYGRNIDLDNNTIHVEEVKDSKEGRGRDVPINHILKGVLEAVDFEPNKKLFGSFNYRQFFKAVDELGLNEGVESDLKHKVTFHTLRHTFASWLAIQGESLLTIRDLLGHKNIQTTMRYAHLIKGKGKSVVDSLADSFLQAD